MTVLNRASTLIIFTAAISAISFAPASARSDIAKPGNCAILADMAAKTVKKDKRFDGHKDIAPALMKFSEAQNAKMKAGMAQTYQASKAFGWDMDKVDSMIIENEKAMRAGFFTSTMDEKKIYMDHVQAVYACANAQKTSADLGQPAEALVAVIQSMAKIIQK